MKSLRATCLCCCMIAGCGQARHTAMVDYTTMSEHIQQQTDRAKELNLKAVGLVEDNDYQRAEAVLKDALSYDVTYGPAHNNLGKVYFHQQKYYLAAWEFEHASRLMPHQPEPRNNLGLVFENVGRIDDAVSWFEKALEIEPDNPLLIGNLARAKLERGDKDEQVHQLLSDLVLRDTRPEWVAWSREQLALLAGAAPDERAE